VVIAAGAFDGDEEIAEVVSGDGLPELLEGVVEGEAVVFDERGWDEDVAEEVGEHPFGAGLGTIDGDDAKVFGSDLLDARVEGAGGLL
jgi:hypothetical protein